MHFEVLEVRISTYDLLKELRGHNTAHNSYFFFTKATLSFLFSRPSLHPDLSPPDS